MFSQIIAQLTVYFRYLTLPGSGIAILIGLLWLLAYRLPLLKQPRLWLVVLGGALAGVLAVSLIQTPLNILIKRLWSDNPSLGLFLLVGLLSALMTGFVQEGAKLIPLWLLRRQKGEQFEQNEGLVLGAAAGLGYGWLETFWITNYFFASGLNWNVVHAQYPALLLTGMERICILGLQMGLTALVGWGWAKGKGLRFFLLAVLLHTLAALLSVLLESGLVPLLITELVLLIEVIVLTVVMVSERGEEKTEPHL